MRTQASEESAPPNIGMWHLWNGIIWGIAHISIHPQFVCDKYTIYSDLSISVSLIPEISIQTMMFDGSAVSAAAGIVHI
jgi:hypothetical protein